jgi:hypothetical protein
MTDFAQILSESEETKRELLESGIVDFWITYATDTSKVTENSRQIAVSLLTELWINYPDKINEREDLAENILKTLKAGLRETAKLKQFLSISQLFRLLDTFSQQLNSYAPIIYKSLTFSMIENHGDLELREYFLVNFVQTFERLATIPVSVVVEPLIKQINVSDDTTYQVNNFDFDFFISVARH